MIILGRGYVGFRVQELAAGNGKSKHLWTTRSLYLLLRKKYAGLRGSRMLHIHWLNHNLFAKQAVHYFRTRVKKFGNLEKIQMFQPADGKDIEGHRVCAAARLETALNTFHARWLRIILIGSLSSRGQSLI
jgi:hypothetical protein